MKNNLVFFLLLAQAVFSLLAFDRQGNLAADRVQQVQIALGIRVFIRVVLHNKHAQSRRRRAQRHAEPRGRGRAEHLDVSISDQLGKRILANQQRLAGA